MGRRPQAPKRVVIISDLHCGHKVGLTHPNWQYQPGFAGNKYLALAQKEMWDAYASMMDKLKPIDMLIVNGDCIDGRNDKSGGVELCLPDRIHQVGCAADCIKYAESPKTVIVRGTDYHVGKEEDWEDILADKVGAISVTDQEYVDVNGLMFDVKHYVGSSRVPHGRYTAIAREKVWNTLCNERHEFPKCDIIIRSHVHYHGYVGGVTNGGYKWIAITTPSLQGFGDRFGTRKCNGTIDYGMIYFDVVNRGQWSWGSEVTDIKIQNPRIIKL